MVISRYARRHIPPVGVCPIRLRRRERYVIGNNCMKLEEMPFINLSYTVFS